MDFSAVVSIGGMAASGAATVAWWMFRRLQAEVDANKEALAAYKLHVAETYVTGNELSKAIDAFNRSIDAIFTKLDRIESKVDMKADK